MTITPLWPLGSFIVWTILLGSDLCLASTITPRKISLKVPDSLSGPVIFGKETIIPIDVNIMTSQILEFAPWLELHHVVFVGEPGSKNVYAVDFSPLNQKDNLLRLLFGIDVPAEIRIRLLNTDDVNDVENIYKKWSCLNKMSNGERSPPHHDLLLLDNDLRLAQKFITRVIKRWDTSMNAYTHNCQHFSWFVKDLLKEEEVCPL